MSHFLSSLFVFLWEYRAFFLHLAIICQPLSVILYRFWTKYQIYPEVPTQRANLYLIMREEKIRGLLIGTMHLAINAKEARPWINVLNRLIGTMHIAINAEEAKPWIDVLNQHISELTAVFTEAPLPHHSLLSGGLEKPLLAKCESHSVQVLSLEDSVAAQQAMVYGCEKFLNHQIGLPFSYWFIQKFTTVVYMFAIARKIMLFPLQFLQNMIYPSFSKNFAQEDVAIIGNLRKNLFSGFSYLPRYDFCESFFIKERDVLYAQKIDQYLNNDEKNMAAILVGLVHLSENGCLYEELEKKGWSLVPAPCILSLAES